MIACEQDIRDLAISVQVLLRLDWSRPVFSQMFIATESEPDEEESGRLGKYASSASSTIGKGVEKARPMLAKMGSAMLTGLRKLGEFAMKGLRSSIAAVRSQFGKQLETEEAAAVSAGEAPQPADEEPQDEL